MPVLKTRILQGDEAAFTRLYELFYRRLYSFSLSLVRVSDIANEVVEDVFMKVWTSQSLLRNVENLSVYLYVAVKNQSLNRLSAQAREWMVSGLDNLEPDVAVINNDPYTFTVTNEMLNRVNHAIDQLPPRCKMIFKLIREDGLKYKEVAAILNISVNTIDVQMATAVKRISEALGIPKNIPQQQSAKKI
ncbi:RNA polymerase sigma factor [Niabella soli]|uniref:RNA polymerase sigma factor n=1 Tax=Niabella soli TaxID=446683 RepID=UPI0002499CBC|nr:RNA polymerase sigma-70 factor [Niabella soli]